MSFGKEIREKEFSHHDHALVRLNNGSFGACPQSVLEAQSRVRSEWMRNPDDFWHKLPEKFLASTSAVASRLIGTANPQDIVLIDNLTTAISVIIHSVITQINISRPVIIASNFTYNAVMEALRHACKLSHENIRIEIVSISFPLQSDDCVEKIIEAYDIALKRLYDEGNYLAFSFLDHITSVPCIKMPVKELIALHRKYGVKEVTHDKSVELHDFLYSLLMQTANLCCFICYYRFWSMGHIRQVSSILV
jgi:selenocysteine lyase/cysteine desulfurase